MNLRRPTGQAAFAGDLLLPGTLHLALRHSPVAHGRVGAVAAASARALPGVAAVLTSHDLPRLFPNELRFVGDRLALAAAEEPELARRAVELVAIEVERLPAQLDPLAAARDEALVLGRITLACGDAERELARASRRLSAEWWLPFTPALALEPPQAITWLDEDRRLVVRTSAESPLRVRRALAERLALPAAAIRVVRPLSAGGAAGDGSPAVEDLCAAVTLRTGRPARLILTGNEQLASSRGRPAQQIQVRLGLDEGRIVALDLRFLLDLGATDEPAHELLRSAARHALALYAVPHVRVEALAVRTHRPPSASARGADTGPAFAIECAVEEAARLVGEPPIRFRERQLRRPGTPGGELLERLGEPRGDGDERTLASLLAALPAVELAVPAAEDDALRTAVGFGWARRSAADVPGAGPAASLHLLEDGSFTLSTGSSAPGGADESAEAAVAAALLSVPPERIVLAAADSDSAAFEAIDGAAAFATSAFAVEEAARAAHAKIRERAALLLVAPLAELRIESGRVHDGRGRSLTFAEIGVAALEAGSPLVATAAPSAASAPPSLAVAQAQVTLDVETGVVCVRAITAALAEGPFADPRPHETLAEGALALGLEQALVAGLASDDEGRPAVRALRDYPLVLPVDVPPLRVSLVPSGTSPARLGDAALADVATRAALAAIANAVSAAAGAPARRLPLSPPAVLALLGSAPADEPVTSG